MGIDGMSMDYIFHSLVFQYSAVSGDIYYNISKYTFNSLWTHVFNRECQLGVHTLKDKRRAKEKLRLYKAIESK